jgi:nicotinamidase-related amidase
MMAAELTLDVTSTALVVIDLQKGIAEDPSLEPYSAQQVIANAAILLQAFRKKGMAVFLVRVELARSIALAPASDLPPLDPLDSPPGFADLVPEMTPLPLDTIITKRQWGAFYGTELDLHLRRRGIRTLVLCGITTDYGVESTARSAYERGYQQVFAEDAMTAASEAQHTMAVDSILKRLGRVRSTRAIVDALG